jgi:hypothetical protein
MVKKADVDADGKKADVDADGKKADVDADGKKADVDADADASLATKIANGVKTAFKRIFMLAVVLGSTLGVTYLVVGYEEYQNYISNNKKQEENLIKLEKCVEESNPKAYASCQIQKPKKDKNIMVNQEKRNAYQVENNKYIDCLEKNLEKECEYDKDIIREFLDIPSNPIAKGLLELENIDLVGLLNEVTLITGIFFIIGLILMQIKKSRIQMTGIVMIFLSIVVFIWYNFIRN